VETGAPYTSSLVYDNGLLFMATEMGIVTCLDAKTGERVWRERLGGIYSASPVAADGKVYLFSESGETLVLRSGERRSAGPQQAQCEGHRFSRVFRRQDLYPRRPPTRRHRPGLQVSRACGWLATRIRDADSEARKCKATNRLVHFRYTYLKLP
jgi:hypothetical protein